MSERGRRRAASRRSSTPTVSRCAWRSCPEPTILPARSRGLHLALTRHIDSEVEEALFFAAVPDEEKYFARQGADRLAMFRFIRDRKYGAGFCDRMEREHEANMVRVREVLEPFEMALEHGAFLLGGPGLADFALYGQLHFLALTGVLKIPHELPRAARVLRPRRSHHGGAGGDGDLGDFDHGRVQKAAEQRAGGVQRNVVERRPRFGTNI